MTRRPNAIQKLLHRFVMLKPVTTFFATRTHRIDNFVLKLTSGKHTVSEFLGWPIIELTTSGAKTGRLCTIPLIALFDGEKIAVIASSFGREHNPGWYYNLKANPKCTVKMQDRSGQFLARQTEGAQREKYWQLALSYYQGYEAYRARTSRLAIPVMVLEPVK